jgi:hypothetical protein
MRVNFRSEEKSRREKMETEATLVHSDAISRLDEGEEIDAGLNVDEYLLEELLRKEDEEMLALLATLEETKSDHGDVQDVVMSDIDTNEAP